LLPFYRHVLGNDRVFFVPLGVDLGFFCPTALPRAEQAKRNFSCLFVGQYLRDFDVLARVASILASEDPRVTFHVVTSEASHHHFLGLANVTVHESIPDGELLCLYRSSDLFVFPLLDCTANCSLLEALACGLPVITTDLTGTRDYLDLNCAVFTPPGDAETMAQAIVSLVEHPRRLRKMAVASRARARQFSWPRVANQVINVYRHLYRDTVR
jgi:glycosyltransferase involved in cell wall biosynthesis